MVDAGVFKAYDVRGLFPEQITPELAYKVARSLVLFLGAKEIVIGYDMRKSSGPLSESLAKGAMDQGANVHIIGLCTTPLLNFATASHKYDAGIMVSASHNPSQYNAFKLVKHPVIQIGSETGMNEIKRLVLENNFPDPEKKGILFGKKNNNVFEEYLGHVSKFANFSQLKVVVDYGNGVGSITAKKFFSKSENEIFSLFEDPDGDFPNHPANPHDLQNFESLQKAVLKNHADIGIFFDGDADRAAFVDENGKIIPPDFSFCLLALEELKKFPGEKIYYDLRFSKIVREKIEEAGGIAMMEKVGNPIYKELLVNEGGILGGEFSGHVMYRDNHNIDDGLFCAVKLLNILSNAKKEGKTLSQLINPLEEYFQTPEINITVEDNKTKELILENLKAKYSKKGCKILEIDGITAEAEDFWFNARKSNTEPIIRLRIEAKTQKLLDEVKGEVLAIISI